MRRTRTQVGSRSGAVGEELDEDDDDRLLHSVTLTSYAQWRRKPAPISHLEGTSFIKHDTATARRIDWNNPARRAEDLKPVPWKQPVVPWNRRDSQQNYIAAQLAAMGGAGGAGGASTTATPSSSRNPASASANASSSRRQRRARTPSGRSRTSSRNISSNNHSNHSSSSSNRGSARPWSSRSGYDTIRNGTSLNMPSFKQRPKGQPQSVLYTALFPNVAISHLSRPGTAAATAKYREQRQRERTVPDSTLLASYKATRPSPLNPHVTPSDVDVFGTSMKHQFKPGDWQEGVEVYGPLDKAFRTQKGMFSCYLHDAIMKNVDFYKVGH